LTFVNAGFTIFKIITYENKQINRMQLLSIVDLCARWTYTRAGIYKLVKTAEFPAPTCTVSCGKTKLFAMEDIKNYEKERPWLFDKNQKKASALLSITASERNRTTGKTTVVS
jgi:hypothetical protein